MTGESEAPDLVGHMSVRISRRGRKVERVHIRSTRPFAARALLLERTTVEVLSILPLLFSVCRHAQSSAARSAMSAAGAGAELHDADALPVLLETLQEHFSHILIDVPRAIGRDPAYGCVTEVRHWIVHAMQEAAREVRGSTAALSDFTQAIERAATRGIYGEPPSQWLGLEGLDGLRAWAARHPTATARIIDELLAEDPTLGAADVALMPTVQRQTLLAAVAPAMACTAQFEAAPTWNGSPAETGALARLRDHALVRDVRDRCGNSTVARIVARIVELALLLEALTNESRLDAELRARVQSLALAWGEGVGAVQTARGLLLHHARVSDDRVADYQIVAPTAWNFHPRGAAVRALDALEADTADDLMRRAELAVRAIDPCVGYRIEVSDA